VIGVVGGTVTAAARQTGHWISFGITLAMMLALTLYVLYHSRQRFGSHWHKYGPTYLMMLSTVLVMADLTRHCLNDLGWWPGQMDNGWGSDEYRSDCSSETPRCLSTIGVLFTLIATYTGFTILAISTLWNANICDKIKDIKAEWKRLREGDPEEGEARPEGVPAEDAPAEGSPAEGGPASAEKPKDKDSVSVPQEAEMPPEVV